MVGFANTSAREMIACVFTTYGSTTPVDYHTFETTRNAWDPQQPIETLFKQIQDYVDFSEAGGVTIGEAHQISVEYTTIFAAGSFMSACCHWNEKEEEHNNWITFKAHFAATYHQRKHMQREPASASGHHSENSGVGHTEGDMDDATIGAIANLATATAAYRGVVAALMEANACSAKQLEDRSTELKEIRALLKKEHTGRRSFTPSLDNNGWSHGYKVVNSHTAQSCNYPNDGHKRKATKNNTMGGSQANNE
jgi:hypothetical protein